MPGLMRRRARPVLLVTGEYPPRVGGVGDYTANLRGALAARGASVSVLTTASLDRADVPVDPTVRTVDRWDAVALRSLPRVAPPRGVVHIQYQPAAFGLRGEICLVPWLMRARRPDARVVTTFHDARVPYLFPGAGPLRALAVRSLARGSHAVLAADPRDLAWLGVAAARAHLVPIGSNVPCYPPAGYDRARHRQTLLRRDGGAVPGTALDREDAYLLVAYFGFLNQSKGLDTLVEAFRRIVATEPHARLLLLGGSIGASDPTDEPSARSFLEHLGPLATRVIRPGYLAPRDLSAALLAADVALLPYRDGASMRRGSLLACITHQLPVVTTTGPGLHTPLAEAVVARPPGDPASLAEAVLTVAHDPTLRQSPRSAAARTLAGMITWDHIAARHLAIYDSLQ